MLRLNEIDKNFKLSDCFHGSGWLAETFFEHKRKRIVYRKFYTKGNFIQQDFIKACRQDMKKYIEDQKNENKRRSNEAVKTKA